MCDCYYNLTISYHEKLHKKISWKIFSKEKGKRWQYGHERYRNMSEDEKQKLVIEWNIKWKKLFLFRKIVFYQEKNFFSG